MKAYIMIECCITSWPAPFCTITKLFMRQAVAGGQVGGNTEEQHKRTSIPCLKIQISTHGWMLPRSFFAWQVSWISLGQVTCLQNHNLCFLGQRGQVGGWREWDMLCLPVHLSASLLQYQWFTNLIVVRLFTISTHCKMAKDFVPKTHKFSKNAQFQVFHEWCLLLLGKWILWTVEDVCGKNVLL